jgi:prepilin-type N-terminal cleavage/methylation domain-containing protein
LLRRRAFTLLEVVAAIALIAILAAILYPTIAASLRNAQAGALGATLENIRTGISNFHDNVGAYPRTLSLLTTQPVFGNDDSCGTNLSAGERGDWRGPYMTAAITGDFPVGDGTVDNDLVRVPATGTNTPGILQVIVTNVDSTTAYEVESQFDGGPDYAAGTILWASTGPQIGTLTFQISIRGC